MEFSLFVQRNTILIKCPECGTQGNLSKYGASTLPQKILKFFRIRKFYCKNCGWEGHKFIIRITKNIKQVLLSYFLLFISVIILAYIVIKIVLRK